MFEIRKCINPECGLRYPSETNARSGVHCPRCRSDTTVVVEGYGPLRVPDNQPAITRNIEVLLDNIRSAWNVGSIFRSADGAGIAKLHLCGITPTPENTSVLKTSLGSEKSVPWIYRADGVEWCAQLRRAGYEVWALEGGDQSVYLPSQPFRPDQSYVLVVGNEVTGIDPGILTQCVKVVHLPMLGAKKSLNVAVASSIAMYWMMHRMEIGYLRGINQTPEE